jgi:ClpA/ClpB-like protein
VTNHSDHGRQVLQLAKEEAALLGHRYLGPEHLVLGMLHDRGSGAARVLRAHGVDLAAARAGLRRLGERGVVPGPRPSDAQLLGALGIDLGAVRRSTEETFGRTALGWGIREATRARRGGVARVPRTPLPNPPVLVAMALQLAGEQATALGRVEVGPELLLLGVVKDIQARRPRCMSNRWMRQLHASVGLPEGYRGAAGPLFEELRVDLDELREALLAELQETVP